MKQNKSFLEIPKNGTLHQDHNTDNVEGNLIIRSSQIYAIRFFAKRYCHENVLHKLVTIRMVIAPWC